MLVRKVILLALCVLVPLAVSAQQSAQTPAAAALTPTQTTQLRQQLTSAIVQQAGPTAQSVSIYEVLLDARGNLLAHAAVTMSDNSVVQLVGVATLTRTPNGLRLNGVASASLSSYSVHPVPGNICRNGLVRVAQYSWRGQSRGASAVCHKEPNKAGFFDANGRHYQIYQVW